MLNTSVLLKQMNSVTIILVRHCGSNYCFCVRNSFKIYLNVFSVVTSFSRVGVYESVRLISASVLITQNYKISFMKQ